MKAGDRVVAKSVKRTSAAFDVGTVTSVRGQLVQVDWDLAMEAYFEETSKLAIATATDEGALVVQRLKHA